MPSGSVEAAPLRVAGTPGRTFAGGAKEATGDWSGTKASPPTPSPVGIGPISWLVAVSKPTIDPAVELAREDLLPVGADGGVFGFFGLCRAGNRADHLSGRRVDDLNPVFVVVGDVGAGAVGGDRDASEGCPPVGI